MTRANVVVGVGLFTALAASLVAQLARPAQAQVRPFRECYIMRLWDARGGEVADKLAPVPPGWMPIGGAGGDMTKGVVLCR